MFKMRNPFKRKRTPENPGDRDSPRSPPTTRPAGARPRVSCLPTVVVSGQENDGYVMMEDHDAERRSSSPVATCERVEPLETAPPVPPSITFNKPAMDPDASDIESSSSSRTGSIQSLHEKRRRYSEEAKALKSAGASKDAASPVASNSMSLDGASRMHSTFPRSKVDRFLERESSTHLSAHAGTRRGSFIFRQSSKGSSNSSVAASLLFDGGKEEELITPFNQTTHSLKKAIALQEMAISECEKLYRKAANESTSSSFDNAGDESLGTQIGRLTRVLEVLRVCSRDLDEMGTQERTVGKFAAEKFASMLSEEVSAQPNVADWISNQFTTAKPIRRSALVESSTPRPRHSIASINHAHHPLSPTLVHSVSMPSTTNRHMGAIAEPNVDETDGPIGADSYTSHQRPSLNSYSKKLPLPVIDSASEHSSIVDDDASEEHPAETDSFTFSLTFATGAGLRCTDMESLHSLMRDLDSFRFDIFKVAELTYDRPFVPVVMSLFKEWNLLRDLEISDSVMANYLTEIELKYCSKNPYHNSWHGADVAQTAHVLILKGGLEKHFSRQEIFGLLLSAAVHDVGHIGYNNDYLVKTRHELALMYNDQSVLENLHSSIAITLGEDKTKDCQIFDSFNYSEYCDARARIIKLILATDPKKHVEMLGSFTSFSEGISVNDVRAENGGSIFRPNDASEKSLVLETLLHSADISNPCKPHHLSQAWTNRIVSEFYAQGDKEKAAGFTPHMVFDRNSGVPLYDMQIGFIKGIVQPQWEAWHLFSRHALEEDFDEPLDNLSNTMNHWETLKQADGDMKERAEAAKAAGDDLVPISIESTGANGGEAIVAEEGHSEDAPEQATAEQATAEEATAEEATAEETAPKETASESDPA
ncbi:3',5'-cyclic-AMP phosphodiesterase 4D-like isoform X2 [Sycon ciliatum]|uniref:3',5'-cyclic-AMP phosphodiesterase 4D-like isoform X2 n=1 Tax=Sycon ciliatum TaxID=27933 RepID=UPI0031F6A5BB